MSAQTGVIEVADGGQENVVRKSVAVLNEIGHRLRQGVARPLESNPVRRVSRVDGQVVAASESRDHQLAGHLAVGRLHNCSHMASRLGRLGRGEFPLHRRTAARTCIGRFPDHGSRSYPPLRSLHTHFRRVARRKAYRSAAIATSPEATTLPGRGIPAASNHRPSPEQCRHAVDRCLSLNTGTDRPLSLNTFTTSLNHSYPRVEGSVPSRSSDTCHALR